MNIGHSSRLPYDDCAYPDKLNESTAPLAYRLSKDQMFNKNACLSTLGPRGRFGISQPVGHVVAPSQAVVDVESLLSNRNMKISRCKTAKVNNINMKNYTTTHAKLCNNFLNSTPSKLTHPSSTYREMPLNRFFNLPKDPQASIFWNFSVNTQLEMSDNFVMEKSVPQDQQGLLPTYDNRKNVTCGLKCNVDSRCPQRN
jgi:hypothetical protein